MPIGFTRPACQIYNFLDATTCIKYEYRTFKNYTILKYIYKLIHIKLFLIVSTNGRIYTRLLHYCVFRNFKVVFITHQFGRSEEYLVPEWNNPYRCNFVCLGTLYRIYKVCEKYYLYYTNVLYFVRKPFSAFKHTRTLTVRIMRMLLHLHGINS